MATQPTHPASVAHPAHAQTADALERPPAILDRWQARRAERKKARLMSARNRRVTDVPGVLLEESVVPELHARDADQLLGNGTFAGGIVPKLQAAVRAARLGVRAQIGATAVLP